MKQVIKEFVQFFFSKDKLRLLFTPQKITNRIPYDSTFPLLNMHPKALKAGAQTDIYTLYS